MTMYLLPAVGSRESTEGIRPVVPDGIINWAGCYDETSHQYVIKTDDVPADETGLVVVLPTSDVGFDFSSLLLTHPDTVLPDPLPVPPLP